MKIMGKKDDDGAINLYIIMTTGTVQHFFSFFYFTCFFLTQALTLKIHTQPKSKLDILLGLY
jgi:hypothetical protein